jgi:hypothetical protein
MSTWNPGWEASLPRDGATSQHLRPAHAMKVVRRALNDLLLRYTERAAPNRASAISDDRLAIELRIYRMRWVGIALCGILVPFLGLSKSLPLFYALLAAVGLYNLLFSRIVAAGRPRLLLRIYTYGVFDTIVATAIIANTGGADSPVFFAYFIIVVHAAVRFGRGVAILTSLVTALCYIVSTELVGHDVPLANTLLRSGFIALTAYCAGLLSDRAFAAERALTNQLDQARALNVAGSILAESLEEP